MAKTPKPAPAGDNAEKAEAATFDFHKSRILRHRRGPLALAKAAYDKLVKAEKGMLAEAKEDGIKIEQFKLHLKKAELERQKPGVGKEHASIQAKYDRWGGLSVGTQGDLFTPPGLTPTPGERADAWFERGYNDIRYGELDPEGFEEEDGTKSPCPLMPNVRPSYVAVADFNSWSNGAQKAQDEINEEFVRRQGGKPGSEEDKQNAEQSNNKEFEGDEV